MSASASPTRVDGALLRSSFRTIPTPVAVVTFGGENPRGITIGSVVSASLEPPLLTFNVQKSARTHAQLEVGLPIAVHMLSAEMADASNVFADPSLQGDEQLDRVAHSIDEAGLPDLHGVVSRFVCEIEEIVSTGDHSIVVGRVRTVEIRSDAAVLLYANRSYTSLS